MTTLAERAAPPARATTLRTLARVEARRYARHPLFLIGVALLIYMTATESYGGFDARSGGSTFVPAFCLGVLGVFVAHGLTRSMARSTEAVEAAPADGITRTAALCLACLVPGTVALAWVGTYTAMSMWPAAESAAMSTAERAFVYAAAVVYAVGGPLVGVLVGRWTRFPGAGLLAAVSLVGWTVLAIGGGLTMPASRLSNLVRLSGPFTGWDSSDGPGEPLWIAGGSAAWYLVYITLLCGLAAIAAMLHEASDRQRSRLVRLLVVVAILAGTSLGLAVAADPTRIPL